MMRYIYLLILILSTKISISQDRMTPENYIATYKEDAVKEMHLNKIPACITLAQGMLESDFGNSKLCKLANNHFGIKCHKEWGGETFIMDDDSTNECFRKYNNDLESFNDHSLFLVSRSRYAPLFELSINDYKGWCIGLKTAGYATDPKYPQRLISIIEKYNLQKLTLSENNFEPPTPQSAHIKSDFAIREVFRFNHVNFIIVKANDSYYKIAYDFNLELQQLFDYNDLSKTDKLSYGQKIYIEKKRRRALEPIHVVQKNETLKSIAQLHGIRLSSVCKKNKLKPNDIVKVGDVLYLIKKKPIK